jgi:hypothetical protein
LNRASRCLSRALLPLALVVSGGTAAAAPVSYQESVGGDLAGFSPLTVFTLDAGINTISGRYGETSLTSFDWDSFAFLVPDGIVLDSVAVTISDAVNDPAQAFWGMFTGTVWNAGTLLGSLFPESPGASSFAGPFDAGSYNISVLGFGRAGTEPGLVDYTFSLTAHSTAQVSEPSPLALLAAACIVCGIARRRKAR